MKNSQLWQQPNLRDYPGVWNAAAAPMLEGFDSSCYQLALFSAPKFSERAATGTYQQIQIPLIPGSFILGWVATTSEAFRVLVTDLARNRPLSNAPLDRGAFLNAPLWLPSPYPVSSPGLFRVEVWHDDGIVCEIVLLVAEPKGVS